MELREKIKDDSDGTLKMVLPLGIPGFLLLGRPIELVMAKSFNCEKKPHTALF